MFKIDLHVHTGRYSQCAETVNPYRIEEYALRAGLDGVVLTDHDVLWEEEELQLLRERSQAIRIFGGIEVSAGGAHLVIIGLEDAGRLHRGIPVSDACNIAHQQSSCVILAHPYRDADPERIPVELVDAIEVGSTSFTAEEANLARLLAKCFQKPPVACSDAHALSRIGWGWTELPEAPANERLLAEMITSGVGTPVAPRFLS